MRRIVIICIGVALLLTVVGLLLYFHYRGRNNNEIVLFGNVDVRQVDLGFRVEGRVAKLFFEEGDLVRKGELMAILDPQPYADEVRQAEATLLSAEANFRNAQRLLARRKKLIGEGGVSQEDLDNAIATAEIDGANVKVAVASAEVARLYLSYTQLYAPTDGTILTRIREPGTAVRATDPIFTLSILSPVWIRCFISEPQLGLVYPGMAAEVHTDTPGGAVYHGQVGFISPVAEFTPKTVETTQLRTDLVYRIRVYVSDPDWGLRQGMPVTVKLPLSQQNGQQ
jgi:membrane fusion protein YbhG